MAHTISMYSIVVAAEDQTSAELSGEAVILNLKSGMYYGLNAVGSTVWGLIQEPSAVNDIYRSLLQEYDVDADRCRQDLFSLLQQMETHGLIEVKNGETA